MDVLKIEGRGKSADYVYTVTKAYREAIDAFAEGSYTKEKISNWMEELATVHNSGFWEGYYLGRKLGEWTDKPGSVATEKKIYLGRHTKYYPRIGVSEFEMESGSLQTGDTIMIISSRFGMVKEQLQSMYVNGAEASLAKRNDKITIPMAEKPSVGDKLYKILKADA